MKVNIKKISLLLASTVLIAIPFALTPIWPSKESGPVRQIVEEKTKLWAPNLTEVPIDEYTTTIVDSIVIKQVQDKNGMTDITFEVTDASETSNEINITLKNELFYISSVATAYLPPDTDPFDVKLIKGTDGVFRGSYKTPQTSWMMAQVLGETFYFETDSFRFAPGYKFDLIKSEGNNAEERPDVRAAQTTWNMNGHPVTTGKHDLIIDLREPWIHNNSHIGGKSKTPSEFYNINDWNKFGGDFDITWDNSNFGRVELWMVDINDLLTIERKEGDHNTTWREWPSFYSMTPEQHEPNLSYKGIYSTREDHDKTLGQAHVELQMNKNGYTRLVVKEAVDVPVDQVIMNKHDGQGFQRGTLTIHNDRNDDGVYEEITPGELISENAESIKFEMNEASAMIPNKINSKVMELDTGDNLPWWNFFKSNPTQHKWGAKRVSDMAYYNITKHETGAGYRYFPSWPPMTIAWMVFGLFSLIGITTLSFMIIGKSDSKKKRRRGIIEAFKNPKLFISDSEENNEETPDISK